MFDNDLRAVRSEVFVYGLIVCLDLVLVLGWNLECRKLESQFTEYAYA